MNKRGIQVIVLVRSETECGGIGNFTKNDRLDLVGIGRFSRTPYICYEARKLIFIDVM